MGVIATKSGTDPEKIDQINRAYVMAFEELLITRYKSSPILNDVIGWMVEEHESFPPEIQTLIDQKANELKGTSN